MSDKAAVEVGSVDEFETGRSRVVKVDGRDLAIVRWGEQWFALRTTCPHQAAPLHLGTVGPRIVGGDIVGEPEVEDSRPVIACPWHGWEFSLEDGRAICDRTTRVATYPVNVRAGHVYVDMGRRGGKAE
jgi:3-phenylpropionate/trans-cinnamate dioxygenase ferredoxin subunit